MTCKSSKKLISGIAACVFSVALSLTAQEARTFRGEVIPCSFAGSGGNADTPHTAGVAVQNAVSCFKPQAKYVLVDSEKGTTYQLDNQRKPKAFVSEKVVVIGTLDKPTSTIHVSEMFRALPTKVALAKSIYIFCDACLRGMEAARPAALQELTDWGRFDVIQNRKKADLILLISANPYLNDYVTRDGPDTRPVHVDITFMNVVDPKTGESLWGDSRQWGSWFVAKATKDLLAEFRKQLEIGDGHAERLLYRMDRDRDGVITREEFMKFMDAEFDRLDTDKDGTLDADELRQLRVLNLGGSSTGDPDSPFGLIGFDPSERRPN